MSCSIVPLCGPTRFLASMLKREGATPFPSVLLPPHFVESFLVSDSQITYTNRINSQESFTIQDSYPLSTHSSFDSNDTVAGYSNFKRKRGPHSLILGGGTLWKSESNNSANNYGANINHNNNKDNRGTTIPPLGGVPLDSDIIIVNPMLLQGERLFKSIQSKYEQLELQEEALIPRVWGITSTHVLSMGSMGGFSVDHWQMGEMRLSKIGLGKTHMNQEDLRGVIPQLFECSPLNMQIESNEDSLMNSIDKLIVDIGVTINHFKLRDRMNLREILNEIISIIREFPEVQRSIEEGPLLESTLRVNRYIDLIEIETTIRSKWPKRYPEMGVNKEEIMAQLQWLKLNNELNIKWISILLNLLRND